MRIAPVLVPRLRAPGAELWIDGCHVAVSRTAPAGGDRNVQVVGAAVGALHGEAALPKRWRDNLLGRTMEADDGYVFDLLDAAEIFFR
jgi:hypothetical protein